MGDRKYAVVFGGELIEGVTLAGVRERLARMPDRLSPAQVDALVTARGASLRLFEERETADRFLGLMREAGMVCWLHFLRPGEQAVALLDDPKHSPGAPATPAIPAPLPVVRPAAGAPRGLVIAIVAVLVCGAAALWLTRPDSRREAVDVAASAQPVVEVAELRTEAGAAQPTDTGAPLPPEALEPGVSKVAYIVPEPTFYAAPPKPPAEAEKLEPEPKTVAAPPAHPVTSQPGSGIAVFAPTPVPHAPPPIPRAPLPKQSVVSREITPSALAPGQTTLSPAEVLTHPTYDRNRVAQPRYPVQAYRNREQGEVRLNVVVGSDGRPKRVTVDKSSGSQLLDRAALDAVKGWQFTPGTRNGVAREAARQVAVGFKLDE